MAERPAALTGETGMTENFIEDRPREDGDFSLDESLIPEVRRTLADGDGERLETLLRPLHAADIADLLEQMDSNDRREIVLLEARSVDGDVLSELDDSLREEVIGYLPPDVLSEAVRDLESDDVVDLVEDLEEEQQAAILNALESADRAAVEQSLSYPEDTAGRLMQREVVIAPEHWTVGETIDFMRSRDDLPEQFYHVILTEPRLKPTGYVGLSQILARPRSTKLLDIAEEGFRTIHVTQPEEDVAYAFNQYHLISAPVVDENGRLVGVITIDDAMVVLDEEHEEDILRLAGVGGESSLSDSAVETSRQRFPWLLINLMTAITASLVIARFEDTIAQFVALAILMPIVASMGGNAGTQSLTVAVRAIATRDLTASNAFRIIRRETLTGFLNGLAFAVVMGGIGFLWFGNGGLGAVIGAAMVINLAIAGLAGALIPISLERLGIDPALASGAFVTTVTDIVGFLAFLGLAAWILI